MKFKEYYRGDKITTLLLIVEKLPLAFLKQSNTLNIMM